MTVSATTRLMAYAALASLILVPLAQAGWSSPEGSAYEGERRVIVDEPAWRRHLAVGPSALAWTAFGWDEEAQGPDRDSSPQVAFVERPLEGEGENRVRYAPAVPSNAPTVGDGYVAWRSFPADSDGQADLGDDAILRVHDLEWNETRTIEPTKQRTGPPTLDGSHLYWATWDRGSEAPDIHRLDLDTGERATWTSPTKCEIDGLHSLERSVLIWCNEVLRWQPGDAEADNVMTGAYTFDVDAPWVATTEYREDDGSRGVEVYLHDLRDGSDRRLTFAGGRSSSPSIDRPLVAWADSRHANFSRDGPTPSEICFQDLRTGNEYKIENTTGISSSPLLLDERVFVGDDRGRLTEIELPSEEERLRARVAGELEERANETRQLNVTVDAAGNGSVAWDEDGDGTFEREGNLTVRVEDEPPNETLQGVVVNESDDYAVVNVDTREVYRSALAGGNGSADEARADPGGNASTPDDDSNVETPSEPGTADPYDRQLDRPRSTPGLAAAWGAIALAATALRASRRR